MAQPDALPLDEGLTSAVVSAGVPQFRTTRRWRFHYPALYITRVRLHDGHGKHVDLWDAGQAAAVAGVLNGGDTLPATGLAKYRSIPWLSSRALIEQRRGAAIEHPVGIANDRALAERVAEILNGLDPYRIAPARRISIHWF